VGVQHRDSEECPHCGAVFSVLSIFNRDVRCMTRGWLKRHSWKCKERTPAERRKWAKPYIGKDRVDSALVVDMEHPGMIDSPVQDGATS
jgi:uncharacterized C2H2 Zn-finger protein